MCSSRWDTPIVGADSWALAVRTHTPSAARDALDEGAARGGPLGDALVHLPHLGLLHDRRDHGARPLAALAHGRDRGHPGVVHVDLGAGLLLDAADYVALRADDIADLVRSDLDRDDARRVLGELRARPGDRLIHDVQDVQPRAARLVERLADDLEVQPRDLDVHLDRGHALA